jgi:hypothetical protein
MRILPRIGFAACNHSDNETTEFVARTCAHGLVQSPRRGISTPTPGITLERDGTLGCYLQWGAMVDGAGLRLRDISKQNVRAVLATHPRRAAFKDDLLALIRAEATVVASGSRCPTTSAGGEAAQQAA